MKAIVLAAGRGSRLKEMTDGQPKCLVELAGKSLLRWQTNALAAGGAESIVVVTGFRHDLVEAQGFPTRQNLNWQNTNMVASLICAEDEIDAPVIVSYSDIVYSHDAVQRLGESDADLGVAFDRNWLGLWQDRFDDPLSDAESFRIDGNGQIIEIGQPVKNLDQIEGQYMGLLKFTPKSMGWVREVIDAVDGLGDRLDMTGLLSRIIQAGHTVTGIDVTGNWCEVDTQRDLGIAEQMVTDGRLAFTHENDAAT